MASDPVGRAEFAALVHRLDLLDERGTSKAGGLLARFEALSGTLEGLQRALQEEKKQRTASRRWLIGLVVSTSATAVAIGSFVLTYVFHVR